MSAPLVVNTRDGMCWTRRGATRGGEALYALAGCPCPEFVMATLPKLAEHGIAGTSEQRADAEPAPVTVYRAKHLDSGITLGHYTTEAEARAHCVAEERRAWAKSETPVFAWTRDEDSLPELVIVSEDGEIESYTSYVVTPIEVASVYDEEADE